jgi:hypothetical protein
VSSWNPDLVILAGLHMLDGVSERVQSRGLLRKMRDELEKFRKAFPKAIVHYEVLCFVLFVLTTFEYFVCQVGFYRA